MSLVLDHPHLTDTLRYKVFSHKRVSQDEVRVAVDVVALVPAADRDQSVRAVPAATDWPCSGPTSVMPSRVPGSTRSLPS